MALPGANPRPVKISEPVARPRKRDPNEPASTTAAKRDARKSRVDDKIKKRMSMRYADNVDFSAVGAMGDIPAMPNMPSSRATKDEVRDDPRAVDVEVMQKEGFDPDACESVHHVSLSSDSDFCVSDLQRKLTNSTEAELKTLQASLLATQQATSKDMQRNIFKKCVLYECLQ